MIFALDQRISSVRDNLLSEYPTDTIISLLMKIPYTISILIWIVLYAILLDFPSIQADFLVHLMWINTKYKRYSHDFLVNHRCTISSFILMPQQLARSLVRLGPGLVITCHICLLHAIAHTCHNFHDGLEKLSLTLGNGWVIPSNTRLE